MNHHTKSVHVRRGWNVDGDAVLASVSQDELDNGTSLSDAFEALDGDIERGFADSIIAVTGEWPADRDVTYETDVAPDATVTLPPPTSVPAVGASVEG